LELLARGQLDNQSQRAHKGLKGVISRQKISPPIMLKPANPAITKGNQGKADCEKPIKDKRGQQGNEFNRF